MDHGKRSGNASEMPSPRLTPLGAALKNKEFPFLLAILLASLPVRAETVDFGPDGSRDDLQDAITNAGAGGTVKLPDGGGITFSNSSPAVTIANDNLTVQGGQASNFAANISSLSYSILSQVNPQATQGIANTVNTLTRDFIDTTADTTDVMSYIKPDDGENRQPTTSDYFYNSNKWLSMAVSSDASYSSLANGLSLSDIHFTGVNVVYTNTRIVNGLIGNVNTADGPTGFGNLTGNAFTNIGLTLNGTQDTQYLAGGGVVGVRSTGNSAYAGNIVGNLFKNVRVSTNGSGQQSPYLEGGGLIGLNAVSSPDYKNGTAQLSLLANNLFTGISVSSGDIILGGGLIGINNNSKQPTGSLPYDPSALLGNASGNIFGNGTSGNISISAGYSLRGGGVIGLNGLSSAAVQLDTLNDNIFNGITVSTGTYIKGGGLVGLHTNDGGDGKSSSPPDTGKFEGLDLWAAPAVLGSVSGNLFLNARVAAQSYIYGGGIIGLRSNAGAATLNGLANNVFSNLTVSASGTIGQDSLNGGGIVGISSQTWGKLADVKNNYFDTLKVSTVGNLNGGGIIGAQANDPLISSTAVANSITGNTFSNLDVRTAATGAIRGGGIIGVQSVGGVTGFSNLSNNRFDLLTIFSGSYLSGGGVIGVQATGGHASISSLVDNFFSRVTVNAAEYIEGAGVVGVRSNTVAAINEISGNWFSGIKVTAGTYIDGGGIVGATGAAYDSPTTGIRRIVDSVFTNNTIQANNGQIMGGLVYSYGLTGGLVISDSLFFDNNFYSSVSSGAYSGNTVDAKVYGTVTVDTGVPAPNDGGTHTLTLRASSNSSTVFQNNFIHEGASARRSNAIYFGTVLDLTGLKGDLKAATDDAEADAALIVEAQAGGGAVLLADPIEVNQNNGHTFHMTVQGSGDLLWGGNNRFVVDAPGTVNLRAGITTLQPLFSLDAPSHDFNLLPGVQLDVMGEDTMTLANANLNGVMLFNLNNTTKNVENTSLLTIHAPQGAVDIEGSTIKLGSLLARGPVFSPGDRFYLIRTDGSGYLTGDPANDHAYARQGLTIGYNFIIDKQAPDETYNNQYLVARLENTVGPQDDPGGDPGDPGGDPGDPGGDPGDPGGDPGDPGGDPGDPGGDPGDPGGDPGDPGGDPGTPSTPVVPTPDGYPPVDAARETVTLVGGRAAGLAFLAHYASWLPDHSYQSADLALNQNRDERAWVPFAGADITKLRTNTGSRITIEGATQLIGAATRHRNDSGAFLLGIFLETGYADYDTRNRFANLLPSIHGDGSLNSFGGGLMARHTWNNDFRIEASLRAGRLKNKFLAKGYVDENGVVAGYKLDGPYVAAHLGVGRGWQISEKNSLDTLLRYFWTRQEGENATLTNGEKVRFYDNESHRVRIGTRLTHTWKEDHAWYVGAALEHEFDSEIKASTHGFALETHDFKGTTGVGEIGLIIRSNKDSPFSIETGLQAYVGEFKGVSGGVRLGWEF
jgi:hypothetical protein